MPYSLDWFAFGSHSSHHHSQFCTFLGMRSDVLSQSVSHQYLGYLFAFLYRIGLIGPLFFFLICIYARGYFLRDSFNGLLCINPDSHNLAIIPITSTYLNIWIEFISFLLHKRYAAWAETSLCSLTLRPGSMSQWVCSFVQKCFYYLLLFWTNKIVLVIVHSKHWEYCG